MNNEPLSDEFGNKEGKTNHSKDSNECEGKEGTPIKILKDNKNSQISKDRKRHMLFQ